MITRSMPSLLARACNSLGMLHYPLTARYDSEIQLSMACSYPPLNPNKRGEKAQTSNPSDMPNHNVATGS
jgi:hypothetical protein